MKKNEFWENMDRIKTEYSIRVSRKPNARSAKRITILISNAYLECGGSVHWVQDLESEVYRAVKEKHLDCDPLEMEQEDRSYTCKNKKSKKLYGKKIKATQFDNHMICTSVLYRSEIPKAILFADILTDYLALEKEEHNAEKLRGDNIRKRSRRTFRRKEGHPV